MERPEAFSIPGGPAVTRADPLSDIDAASWEDAPGAVDSCVMVAPGNEWFADCVWSALAHGRRRGASGSCRSMYRALVDELGQPQCEALLSELDAFVYAIDGSHYSTRTPRKHAALLPHLIRSYVAGLGIPCEAYSHDGDALLLSGPLAACPYQAAVHIHYLLPLKASEKPRISAIRVPGHARALRDAFVALSSVAGDRAEYGEEVRAFIAGAGAAHRRLLEDWFGGWGGR